MTELAEEHTDLGTEDLAWLRLLRADWQIVADLSFADLVLWLPDRRGAGYWAGAQMRPTTGPTAYVDDVVGTFVAATERPLLHEAARTGRLVREGDPEWRAEVPVRVECIPVRRDGRVVAAITRDTNLHGVRTPSRLELSYLQTADDLTRMVATGHFPVPGSRSDHADSPRVGDGFLRVDELGHVVYASPNALSVYRRLGLSGDLAGLSLPDLTRTLVPARSRSDEETLSAVLGGQVHRDTEIVHGDVALIVRAVPLRPGGEHLGALVLLRDVSELRRRDRELVSKDTTIREIHHRVKNNLQTVAALLRLQARRLGSPDARSALEEAVRRVGSIAVVHEMLSQAVEDDVDFDEVADRLAAGVLEVNLGERPVSVHREGSFGRLPSERATTLAMVLSEVVQNAVEHGYVDSVAEVGRVGRVVLHVTRGGGRLRLCVDDDGRGLPPTYQAATSTSLGLSIVRSLVVSELSGRLELGPAPGGVGTRVEIDVPLDAEPA